VDAPDRNPTEAFVRVEGCDLCRAARIVARDWQSAGGDSLRFLDDLLEFIKVVDPS